MFDQLFDGFRKASESSLVAQQEMMKQWVEQWPSTSLHAAGSVLERNSSLQKRLLESATHSLTRQRELLDSSCRAGIQFVEQAVHLSDAKSPDELRRLVEELWRKALQGLKDQTEAQFSELKNASETWIAVAQVPMKAAG